MTGPYNSQTKMAVLNCMTHHFSIKFASLALVVRGQVKGRESSLGLVLGLVSSIEQYFRRNSILFVFFVAVFTAAEASRINNTLSDGISTRFHVGNK